MRTHRLLLPRRRPQRHSLQQPLHHPIDAYPARAHSLRSFRVYDTRAHGAAHRVDGIFRGKSDVGDQDICRRGCAVFVGFLKPLTAPSVPDSCSSSLFFFKEEQSEADEFMYSMIQGAGAGLLVSASTASGFSLGENVILGGLILQILLFGFFVVVAGVWHSRLRKQPMAEAATLPWEGLVSRLYAASGCIMLRNVFRVVEYGMGSVCFFFLSPTFFFFELSLGW